MGFVLFLFLGSTASEQKQKQKQNQSRTHIHIMPESRRVLRNSDHTIEMDCEYLDIGYKIIHKAVSIDPKFMLRVKRGHHGALPIFNNMRGNDKKRCSSEVLVSEIDVPGIQAVFATRPHNMPSPWVAIHSSPGCQEQVPHVDWTPCLDESHGADALSCLVALEDDTVLHVWPGSHKFVRQLLVNPSDERLTRKMDGRKSLTLNKGDVVMFRSDLVHAGAAYNSNNTRLHCYLDAPGVPRVVGTKCVIGGLS
jgi:hypothetical protein